MEVEHVAWIGFAAGGTLEQEGNLAVGDGLFGKVIEHDEGVLALVHEPLTDGAASVRGEVLVHRWIGSGSADDHGVFHGACIFEGLDDAGHVGLLLADGDVDAVEWLVALEFALLSGFVLLGLGNDGVHRDGGFAGGAVTDDEFALATANRDHGVDGHDAGLHGDGHGLTGDDAGSEFFDRILGIGDDRAFAVEGFAQGIDDAAEQAFAYRDGKEAAGGADFVAGLDAFSGTEEHAAHFSFFEVQRETEDPAGELDHLVEHHVAEAFDLGDAVADFTDNADIGAGDGGFEAGDLGFEFLEDRAHEWKWVESGDRRIEKGLGEDFIAQGFEAGFDGTIPDRGAQFDADPAEKVRIGAEFGGDIRTVAQLEIGRDGDLFRLGERRGAFDDGVALFHLQTEETLERSEDAEVIPGLVSDNFFHNGLGRSKIQGAITQGKAQKLPGGAEGVFTDFHGEKFSVFSFQKVGFGGGA